MRFIMYTEEERRPRAGEYLLMIERNMYNNTVSFQNFMFVFAALNLKICDLKLWKPTVQ